MANNLTGDFDVVAEFALPAVNRVLAAMHQCERFLHSISVHVDDNPPPGRPPRPTTVGIVDTFGDPIVNHQQVSGPLTVVGPTAVSDPTFSRLGGVLNPGQLVAVQVPITPSHLQGVAQLQLAPPTVDVPTTLGNSLTVTMNLMARYRRDKNTAAIAEFIRGDLRITAPVNKIASGRVHVLDIDFKADAASIAFTPSFSSQPLSAEDLAGINLCIRNGLITSFLPSSVTLPTSIADVQLKTLPGAIVVMLDLNDHPSTTASVTNVFLAPSDDFAFAVGRDYLLNALRLVSDNILSQTFPPATFAVNLVFETLHYSYPIKLNNATFDLQPGKIVLTINGDAGPEPHGHHPTSFSFTVNVEFSLVPSGPTVELVVGNVSVNASSTLASIVDYFTGNVTNSVKNAISAAINATGAGDMVNKMFNADTNLGNFLSAQLSPADGSAQPQSQQVFLVYNSADIQPAGVVLHGSLLLLDWPAPHVEFEPIPSSTGFGAVESPFGDGPDYSALKTWIPGGRIDQYEWSTQQQGHLYPFGVDPNKFVLVHSGPVSTTDWTSPPIDPYSSLCLTVRGTRLSSFGPVVAQPVGATVCGYNRFPVVSGVLVSAGAAIPMVTLTRPGPGGQVAVTGHTLAQVAAGSGAPNLIVHFADAKSATELQVFTQALSQSKRTDAATAVVAVLSPGQLAKTPYTPGIIYAEDGDGSWQRLFKLKSAPPPFTAIVDPRGTVAWQGEGIPAHDALAAALSKYLAPSSKIRITMPRLNARIGQPAPNFLFEFAPGRDTPLSKLRGQPVALVFWRSSSRPSIEAVREFASAGADKTVVLAIDDGESPETAHRVAAESSLSAVVVADPKREISSAYGVEVWPTIVSVDASGVIAGIRYGYQPAGQTDPAAKPSAGKR